MEKVIEVVEGDDDVMVLVRPMFPFDAERFSVKPGQLDIIGGGSRISLKLVPEQISVITSVDRILLCEFGRDDEDPARELILHRA